MTVTPVSDFVRESGRFKLNNAVSILHQLGEAKFADALHAVQYDPEPDLLLVISDRLEELEQRGAASMLRKIAEGIIEAATAAELRRKELIEWHSTPTPPPAKKPRKKKRAAK